MNARFAVIGVPLNLTEWCTSPYINIAEISLDGEFTEPEIDLLAMVEINDIEKLH